MEQKHLAIPWRVKSAGGKDEVIMSGDIVVAAFRRRDKPEWNELNAAFIVKACNAFDANQDTIRGLVEALEQIRDSETECCGRCEGNGQIYADGKPHYMKEDAPTIPCGNCGGSGRLLPESTQDIAAAAIEAAK